MSTGFGEASLAQHPEAEKIKGFLSKNEQLDLALIFAKLLFEGGGKIECKKFVEAFLPYRLQQAGTDDPIMQGVLRKEAAAIDAFALYARARYEEATSMIPWFYPLAYAVVEVESTEKVQLTRDNITEFYWKTIRCAIRKNPSFKDEFIGVFNSYTLSIISVIISLSMSQGLGPPKDYGKSLAQFEKTFGTYLRTNLNL
jgi:hypothetical protein